jgi:hypothetical protein
VKLLKEPRLYSEFSGERRHNSKGNAGCAVNSKANIIAESRLEAVRFKYLFLKQQKGTLRLSFCYSLQSRSGLQAPRTYPPASMRTDDQLQSFIHLSYIRSSTSQLHI